MGKRVAGTRLSPAGALLVVALVVAALAIAPVAWPSEAGQVSLQVVFDQPGANAFFDATISGTTNYDGNYPGWCVDAERGWLLAGNVVVYGPGEPLPEGLIDKPGNLDLVNWVLNQGFVGQDAGGGLGTYTVCDVAQAIWLLADDNPYQATACGAFTERAEQIAALAQSHDGYEPACGQYYLAVLEVLWRNEDGSSGARQQTLIIPLPKLCASLEIVKDASPEDDTPFAFSCGWDCMGEGDDDFVLTDPTHPSELFGGLEQGTYVVAEDPLTGYWEFGGVDCTGIGAEDWAVDGQDPQLVSVTLEPGDHAVCTFHNRLRTPRPGRIIVEKVTDPAHSPVEFPFLSSWSVQGFALAHGEQHDSGPLPLNTYSVRELLQPDWDLTDILCTYPVAGAAPAPVGDVNLVTGEVTGLVLVEDRVITCTFRNVYNPERHTHLRLVKTVTNDDGGTAVPTDWTLYAAGPTPLQGAGGVQRTEVVPGAYALSESAGPVGYTAGTWSCDGGLLAGNTVTLVAGDDVTCTINNDDQPGETPKGSLTVIKDATVLNPADTEALFSFGGSLGTFELADDDSQTFNNLDAGAYTVEEGSLPISANPPAGTQSGYIWRFDGVDCTAQDWSDDGRSVTVNLAPGEDAVCTFYNGQEVAEGPELPYTGSPPFTMTLLIAGLWALVAGLGMVVWSCMRQAAARH
jgi:hypothetical protein